MASDGKGCRDLRTLIRFRCKGVLKQDKNGKKNYRVLPRQNLEANGAVGANLRPFSFGGSVEPLRWSAQPPGGGSIPIHYLFGYVPPNGVVILKLLV